ncbi:MAG: tRNA (adenosine(37)-N6)-threonylcarbamoyltransferase complex ATPase subunit type 1 TsaE [Planctomycetes bacterium]|nr:tRNA (adenosine(37)-N6)-threonylcarbamoyltransferase complex ATPase subunit type 1 TsaE [Planctomycetota bacterium]
MGTCENNCFEVVTGSPVETIALGVKIGGNLVGGEVIGLVGNLGSGKTHLIKGIAEGLGVDRGGEVNSPTFVLVNEYTGPEVRLDIYHIDAYRLDSVAEFEMLGFDDLCYDRSVVLIEWADKIESALESIDPIRIELSHISENQRKIRLKNITSQLLSALKSQ